MWTLLLALALAQEPPPEPDPVPPGLEDVRRVFATVERFDGVQLDWSAGVARLSGSVPSVAARDQAHALAAGLDDTLFVDDLLAIEEGQPVDADRGDEVTEELLRRVFARIDALKPVEVDVKSGVVRLSGEVLDSSAREQAVALARDQTGVLYVDDAMEESTDVSDRLRPAVDEGWAQAQSIVAMTPLLLVAMLLVGLSWIVARAISGWDLLYRRINDRPLLRNTLARVVRIAIVGVGVVAALEILDATALVGAVVGTAGVFGIALGFAFQDIVENYLAGLLLSVQQPFHKDDLVDIDGTEGIVVRLTARNTLLLTIDGNHVYLPNASVFKGTVTNFSRNPFRRFDFAVGIGVNEDLIAVIRLGEATLRAMPGVVDQPAPALLIAELGDSTVVVEVTGWVDQRTSSFLAVRTEAIRRIKEAYDQAGVDMPEPTYRVQMRQMGDPAPKDEPEKHGAETTAVDLGAKTVLSKQAEEQRALEPGEDLLVDG